MVKLVLQRSLTIARPELERVMQAVLFYSDQVLIRATAVARPGDGAVYRRMREGVSEVVQLRHSITTLRMTDHLGAHGIIGGHPDRSAVVSQIRQVASSADATEAVVSEVVGRCSFGPLGDLPLRAIEECRREMPRFRDFLEEKLTGQATGHPANPHEVAELIMSEYRKINRRGTRLPPAEDSWDVVGIVLPHIVVVKAAGARIEWFKYRGAKRRPFILLGKLQDHAWEAHS